MRCFSCQSIFSGSVIPLMLSCGHTNCNNCVAKFEKEESSCPHCARPFQSSFQNLTFCSMISMVDPLQNSSIPNIILIFQEEKLCEVCEDEETHPATFRCVDCNQFICDSFVQFHKKLKVIRHHKLFPLSELPSVSPDSVLPRLHPKSCPIHNQLFSHYNELIQGSHVLCRDCAIEKAHLLSSSPSLPLSTASLSEQKVQQARVFSPKISDRIASLTSTSQTLSDKIQQLDQSRDLALSQIQNTFQTYRQALDAREVELKSRVEELHKSARFEMEDEKERAQLYVGQLEHYGKGLEEMEAVLTLLKYSTSSPLPEGLLVDLCLLEASLDSFFSHSMEVEVSPTEGVEFRVSEEEEGWKKRLCGLGRVSQFPSSHLPLPHSSSRPDSPPPSASINISISPEVLPFAMINPNNPHSPGVDISSIPSGLSGSIAEPTTSETPGYEQTGDPSINVNDHILTRKTLLSASEKGELEVVRALLDRGDDVNQKDTKKKYRGYTPLHWAIKNDHLPIVSLLLDRGANIEEKNKSGYTPLYFASEKGHLFLVSLLLDRGANIHEKTNVGDTPLHWASSNGHLPIVSLLLDRGANIHEKDIGGFTPFHYASSKGHLFIVSLLLDRGANINEKDNVNNMPSILLKAGYTPLHYASIHGHLPIVSLLLDRGANINEKDKFGFTPLHWASYNGHLPMVSLLRDKGANINEKDNNGKTPLKLAEDNEEEDVAALLRERRGTL